MREREHAIAVDGVQSAQSVSKGLVGWSEVSCTAFLSPFLGVDLHVLGPGGLDCGLGL